MNIYKRSHYQINTTFFTRMS